MDEFATPGQYVEALLTERGWSQRTLAVVLGKSESSIGKMIAGKQSVDANLAIALEEIFKVEASRFLALQQKYDLSVARLTTRSDPGRETRARLYGDLPVAEMIKRGWLVADNIHDTKNIEASLVRFFGANRVEDIEILPHAAKKTAVNGDATPAQLAWLYRVKQIASDMLVAAYTPQTLINCLPKLKALMVSPEAVANVPRLLTEAGVRLVLVESLPKAKIDGVCYWLNSRSPVIGLSLRFDRIDNFWFVLRHEIEHVLAGHGQDAAILDTELEGDRAGTSLNNSEEERAANAAAREFCVPQAQLEAFVARKAPFFSERDLIGFSRLLKIHPGVLAGQLQHHTGRYDRFRDHLAKVRSSILPNANKDGWGDVAPVEL